MIYKLLLAVSFLFVIFGIFIYKYKAWQTKLLMSCIVIASLFSLLLNIFWLCCDYFTGQGFTWAVVYTLTSSLDGAGMNDFILPGMLIVLAIILFLWGCIKFTLSPATPFSRDKKFSFAAILVSILSILFSPIWTQYNNSMLPEKSESGKDFFTYYIKPEAVIKNPQYNLVYIYAESLERTYFDNTHFPGLMNELNSFRNNSLDFSNTTQYSGMDFTIGGIVASQCGLPLFTPAGLGNNTDVTSDFFASQICLGDILKNSGYENYFYQGAELRFANKDKFFQAHNIEHIYGLSESEYKDDLSYQNDWGLYDNIVLDQVWKKFTELSESGKRFALFTLTLDTHPPHGYIANECKTQHYDLNGTSDSTFDAVLCSQRQIARLLKNIMQSKWAKNTIVVVSSDHLAMDNTAVAIDYLKKYERRGLFFVIKDGSAATVNNNKRNTMDNGATVLELLGGGNNIGLGRSSLSRTSLSERFADLEHKIITWSPHIKSLWGTPSTIKDYEVDTINQKFSFNGRTYPLPLLVGFRDNKMTLLTDRRGAAPLRFKLSRISARDHFLWIDRCFQMANVWAVNQQELVLSTDWCKSEGRITDNISIKKIKGPVWHDTVSEIKADTKKDYNKETYAAVTNLLSRRNNDIRYPSDAILFYLDGFPDFVTGITGLGQRENWGRWSDQMLKPSVQITLSDNLPEDFWLEIKAKAYNENAHGLTAIRIGNETKYIKFMHDITLQRIHFTHATGNIIEVIPPHPELSREGNIIDAPLDAPVRKIGIGLVSMKIIRDGINNISGVGQ